MLVPLCGKTVDLLWLASRGLEVTGVEVSDIAVRAFFEENDLAYRRVEGDGLPTYAATSAPVRIVCGDYLQFEDAPFHSLYDRGALIAVPAPERAAYVEHTRRLLEPDAYRMVITLSYDETVVDGPPFSVPDDELRRYWPDLTCVDSRNDIDNAPPKFRAAGLGELRESVWIPA